MEGVIGMKKSLLERLTSVALAAVVAVGCAGAAVATSAASAALDAQPAHAATSAGWKMSSGKWWYAYSDGSYAKGWKKISGCWYYFDNSGWMKTGWLKSGGAWYYLRSSGAMAYGWQEIKGTWYHFGASGAMTTGWLKAGSTWYYLKSSGAMAEGWVKVNGTWYYMRPGSGKMATGWVEINGEWYYLKGSGAMEAGKWIGNYYVEGSGKMATSRWVGKYYVDADGRWIEGFKNVVEPAEAGAVEDWVFSVSYDESFGGNVVTIHNYKGKGGAVTMPSSIGEMPIVKATLSTGSISSIDWAPTRFYEISVWDGDNVENLSSGPETDTLICYCANMGLGDIYLDSAKLIELYCQGNYLQSGILDLTKCPNLQKVDFSGNYYVWDVDITGCEKLTYIKCTQRYLTEDALAKLQAWGAEEGHELVLVQGGSGPSRN